MKIKHIGISALIFICSCSPKTTIQKEDFAEKGPIPLFIIGNQEVFTEEFLHVLSKNRTFQNNDEKLSREEFEDNLELFIHYKLKVMEAENLGLDKTEEFEREFEMFREDLIKPFLIKNSLQDGELMKAYNRSQEVVKASHILLQFPNNSSREDSIAVFRMAEKLKGQVEAGEDFNALAQEHSDDPSATENKGSLGYFTALQMVHQFEDAAFSLQPGQVSDPILTNFGYHIIKLEDRKPNPGEIRVSHILVRTPLGDPVSEERALRKIGDIYAELQKPESSWEEICEMYSEDMGTKNSGGKLPWIGIGSVVPEFEQIAFALAEIGEISPPVKTPYGYHIIRLEDKKPIGTFDEMEPMLKSKILRDSRSTLIQSQVLAIQKSKYGFDENEDMVKIIKTLFEQNERDRVTQVIKERNLQDSTLFSIDNSPKSAQDFLDFMADDGQPVRVGSRNYFDAWLDKYIEVSLSQAEEADLLANNADYRLLVNEYRDGILLFSLMNEQVWQKALEDSIGQIRFYEENQDRYLWKERVQALIVKMGKDSVIPSVRRFLADKKYLPNLEDRLENTFLINDPLAFTMESGLYEWESHPLLKQIRISEGFHEIRSDGKLHFVIIGEKMPPGPKKFEETRGKVIQDYQESLDKNLISALKRNYIIRINEDEKEKVYDIAVHK